MSERERGGFICSHESRFTIMKPGSPDSSGRKENEVSYDGFLLSSQFTAFISSPFAYGKRSERKRKELART